MEIDRSLLGSYGPLDAASRSITHVTMDDEVLRQWDTPVHPSVLALRI